MLRRSLPGLTAAAVSGTFLNARVADRNNLEECKMYGFLLTLLVLDGIVLGVVILIQSGKGGGLAAMGGGAAATDVLGGRQATTLLTRATWIAGSAFMVLALVLAIMSSQTVAATPVLGDLGGGIAPVLQEGSEVTDLIPGAGDENPPGEVEPPVPEPPGAEDPPPAAGESSGNSSS